MTIIVIVSSTLAIRTGNRDTSTDSDSLCPLLQLRRVRLKLIETLFFDPPLLQFSYRNNNDPGPNSEPRCDPFCGMDRRTCITATSTSTHNYDDFVWSCPVSIDSRISPQHFNNICWQRFASVYDSNLCPLNCSCTRRTDYESEGFRIFAIYNSTAGACTVFSRARCRDFRVKSPTFSRVRTGP